MNTTIPFGPKTSLSRRQLLKLAISSALLLSGCAGMQSRSDLDTAIRDLGTVLGEIEASGTQQELTSIAHRIKDRARELAAEHQAFVDNFDRMLSDYESSGTQLVNLIDAYGGRRKLLRDDLLHLQQALHDAMTPEDWARVVRVLNQTHKALAGYTLSEV